jgi:hypothetical protein
MGSGWRGNYLRYKSYFLNIIARYKERADIKAYIEILLSLATVSIFAIFALRPTLLTIAGLIKEIDSKKQTIEIMQSKIDNITKANNIYNLERNKINILLNAIPDTPNPEVYARQIEGLSGRYNLEISEIFIGEAVILGKKTGVTDKNKKDLKKLPEGSISLSVSTTYKTGMDRYTSLVDAISNLESLRRPAQVDTIQIKTSTTEDKEKVLELSIDARLPYYVGGIK